MVDSNYGKLIPLEWLMPRAYTRQMFAFPSTDRSVVEKLKEGLAAVTKEVPYLLSGVVNRDSPHGAVALTEPYQTPDDLFSWHDLSASIDFASMKQDHFPPGAFSVPGLIPPDTVPPYPTPAPVFRAHLALVNGGFLLCVAVHHNTTDITGSGALLKLWASNCRTGSSAPLGFNSTWLDRESLFNPGDARSSSSTSVPKLLHIRKPTEQMNLRGSRLGSMEYKTGTLFFAGRILSNLKQRLNASITSIDPGSWVSTGDILTALLWSAIIEVEDSDSNSDPEGVSTIGFPVNFRSRLSTSLPKDYLGAAFVMTAATASRRDLLSFSRADKVAGPDNLDSTAMSALSKIALTIRESVNAVDEMAVREVLDYVHSQADIQPIVLGPRHDGISIVSWADQGVYELDWGETIGRCEAVRLPKFMYKRYPIIQPRVPESAEREGGLEVIVSFDEEKFDKFKKSWPIEHFSKLYNAS